MATLTEFADSYPHRKERLRKQMRIANSVRLEKKTSNLFRDRIESDAKALSVSDFNHLLEVDSKNLTLTSEGMITYGDLVDASLPHGFIPAVVPQLKSITIGGALAGVGIESTSFRHGLTHESVVEMDVLLPDGSIITCNADNEHSDLYYGLPNSYGTLGYVLSLKVKALPTKPFVQIKHQHFSDPEQFFATIDEMISSEVDFLDGSIFSSNSCFVTTGNFVDEAPFVSDYTYMKMYFRSIQDGAVDYLTTHDYLWRWDTDWFWCSKNLYVQNPILRRLVGRKRLNSTTYTKVMRWNSKWGVTRRLNQLAGYHCESVIQDIDIPIGHAPEFLGFLMREIGVLPIWICPIGTSDKSTNYPLFPLRNDTNYVNFGFWDSTKTREKRAPGYLNKKIERMTAQLGGIKSLYSDTYFAEEEFWKVYNQEQYLALKQKYDPQGKLLNLYDKCVLRK